MRDPWVWLLSLLGLGLGLAGAPLGAASDARAMSMAALATSAALLCWALAGARLGNRSLPETLALGPRRSVLGVGDAVLLGAGLLGLSHLLDLALHWSGVWTGSQLGALDAALRDATAMDAGLLVIGLVLAPALAEELLFRGLLLGGLERRLGAGAAVAISAVLFGLAHLELVHGAAATALGAYLGAVRIACGSVRLPVVLHACNNAAALAAALWAWGPDRAPVGLGLATGALGALTCLVALLRLRRLGGAARPNPGIA